MTQSNTDEWNKEEDQVNQVISHIVSDLIESTLEELLACQLRTTTSTADINQ